MEGKTCVKHSIFMCVSCAFEKIDKLYSDIAAKDARIFVLETDLGNILDSNKQAEDEITRLREALKLACDHVLPASIKLLDHNFDMEKINNNPSLLYDYFYK